MIMQLSRKETLFKTMQCGKMRQTQASTTPCFAMQFSASKIQKGVRLVAYGVTRLMLQPLQVALLMKSKMPGIKKAKINNGGDGIHATMKKWRIAMRQLRQLRLQAADVQLFPC